MRHPLKPRKSEQRVAELVDSRTQRRRRKAAAVGEQGGDSSLRNLVLSVKSASKRAKAARTPTHTKLVSSLGTCTGKHARDPPRCARSRAGTHEFGAVALALD